MPSDRPPAIEFSEFLLRMREFVPDAPEDEIRKLFDAAVETGKRANQAAHTHVFRVKVSDLNRRRCATCGIWQVRVGGEWRDES